MSEIPEQNASFCCNMKELKLSFFSRNATHYDGPVFSMLLNSGPYKFYEATYVHMDEYNDSPEFIVNNLMRGFVCRINENSKCFLALFRIIQTLPGKYIMESFWITDLQTIEEIKETLGETIYDCFIWKNVVKSEEFLANLEEKVVLDENTEQITYLEESDDPFWFCDCDDEEKPDEEKIKEAEQVDTLHVVTPRSSPILIAYPMICSEEYVR